MRKVIVSNVMSLDGYFEDAKRSLDWFVVEDEFFAYSREMLNVAGLLVFGRKTYEVMAAYWPSAAPDAVAEKMNGLPKIVFSRTLAAADWNNSRLLKGNLAGEIAGMKQPQGKDIVVLGSATVASALLQAGLVDEYRVIVNPVLLGSGNLLFRDIHQRVKLKLLGVKSLSSGVMIISYERA